jgi:hypothetical protein
VSAKVPLAREDVLAARTELLRLAARLREPARVSPRGVALTRALLMEPDSPLYRPEGRGSVWALAHGASEALDEHGV